MSKAERVALKGGGGTPPTTDKKKDYDHLLKLMLIGDGYVGKSRLLSRFVGDTFNDTATIGIDFRIWTVEINREKVKLQIWDTPGNERCRSIVAAYMKSRDSPQGLIVAYDVNNQESFVQIKQWLRLINQNCRDDVCRILVGCKNDCPDRKMVDTTEAYMFAEELGINLFETSAKENINVEEMFICITELVLRAKKEELAKEELAKEVLAKEVLAKQKINTPTERSIGDWLREHQQRLQTAFDGARDQLLAAAHRRKERHDE